MNKVEQSQKSVSICRKTILDNQDQCINHETTPKHKEINYESTESNYMESKNEELRDKETKIVYDTGEDGISDSAFCRVVEQHDYFPDKSDTCYNDMKHVSDEDSLPDLSDGPDNVLKETSSS